jgi:hypothetical protein
MKPNFFTAALESDSTVGVDAIHTQETLQPKPGFGEDKSLEVQSDDDLKVAKAFGEDHDFADHDEIDTVAESQEHTLALEHLQATALRFCRMGAALEEIAETVETNLEAGVPMDPTQVAMVTTALDAAGVGEPLEESVALESFGFDANVATEGFVETIKERAKKVWAAVSKFAKKAWEVTLQKLKRFADYFRGLPSIYAKLEKEGTMLTTSKPFQNAKWEKAVQDGLYAPASTKTVIAAIDNALAEYREVSRIVDGKLASDLKSLKSAWRGEKAETVVAVMNKVLASVRPLSEMNGTRFKHASSMVEVNLPTGVTLQNTGGLEGANVSYEDGMREFSAGVKTATVADIKHLKQSAETAANALNLAWSNYQDAWKSDEEAEMADFFTYLERGGFSDEKGEVARKLLTKYTNLMRVVTDLTNAAVYSTADGLHSNHRVATRWIRFSIAEAKAAARGDSK